MVSITANSLLDVQILSGIILIVYGINPPGLHLLMVGAAAVLTHYSYSVEKRHGSSTNTLAAAWGSVIPVSMLFI